MGIIPHFLLQCAFQRAFHFAFQNAFQPQPYCRLGFEKSVTPFPKSPRTHSAREPEPPAAKSIVYGVPSPAPVACLIFRLSACRSAVCGITQRAYYVCIAYHAYAAAYAAAYRVPRPRLCPRPHVRLSLRAHHVRPGVPARSAHTSARHVPPGASAPHLMRAGYRPDTHYATRR